jgi:hypothetical protein
VPAPLTGGELRQRSTDSPGARTSYAWEDQLPRGLVNPSIRATEGTGMPFAGVLTATVLVCFVMTLLMGLYAKLP